MIELEIINWPKHNPRASIKHPRWFALSNRILEDSSLFDLSAEEFKAWIYVLCQASQRNSNVVSVNPKHAERIAGIKPKTFSTMFPKLEKAQCIRLRDHGVNTDVPTMITTLHNNTEQNRTNSTHEVPKDFEDIYSVYPKKEGKSDGLKICKREIKTLLDLDLLRSAVARYRKHCEDSKIEKKFIKHFSTFMNQWRDWLDPDVGTSDLKTSADSAWDEYLKLEKAASNDR